MSQPTKAVAKTPDKGSTTIERELLSVAETFEEKRAAFQLAAAMRQSQMIRDAAAAIAEKSWGEKLTPIQRAAVARYALETGTDPVRHWYVLGGRVYDNAELWFDLATAQPDYVGADDPVLIHADERCTPEQAAERRALRVKWGVPEETPGAAIITIHTKDRGDFSGCNWVKTGTYKESGKPRDPVGMEHPTQTAITRAWRKACKKAWSLWFMKHPRLKATEEVLVEGVQLGGRESEVEVGVEHRIENPEQATAPTGVIEKHNPNAICGIEGDHAREICGHFKTKTEAAG